MAEDTAERLLRADAVLATISWDRTWKEMARLIDDVLARRDATAPLATPWAQTASLTDAARPGRSL